MNKANAKAISVSRSLASRQTNRAEILKAKVQANRRDNRASKFYATRGLDIEELDAVQTRAQRMEEFKQKKMRQKIEEQKRKLPPFRAGIVRHTLDSPYKYFNRKEEVVNKPFKFTLKPKLPPAKITIPYSPKFSKICGHRVCLEKTCTTTQTTTLQNGEINSRAATLSARQLNPTNRHTTRSRIKTKLSLENHSEPRRTRVQVSLEKNIDSSNVPQKSAKTQKTSVEKRTSPRYVRNSIRSPFYPPAVSTAEVFKFTSTANGVKEILNGDHSRKENVETNMNNAVMKFDSMELNVDETGTKNIKNKSNGRNSKNDTVTKFDSMELNDESETKNIKNKLNGRNSKTDKPLDTESKENPNSSVVKKDNTKVKAVTKNLRKKSNTKKIENVEQMDTDGNANSSMLGADSSKLSSKENEEPMSAENDLNQSIEIPEFFVKRRSSKDSLRKKCFITPTKEPEASSVSGPEYQRRRVNEERNILHRLCYLWYDTLQGKSDIPTDVRDEIDCIIGQTKLLTSDKFEQMSSLIDQFEAQESSSSSTNATPRILENDLDSFWDMIYIQVELMYKKFDRLKRLQSDEWVDKEEEERRQKENEKRKQKAKVGSKATAARVGAKSRIADFIRNKRTEAKTDITPDMSDQTKVFAGGFFKIESPISLKTRSSKTSEPPRRPATGTPHVKSILKNKMSSLNIVAVSPLAKTLASTTLLDFIGSPSDDTKSILKSSNKPSRKLKTATPGGKKICFTLSESNDEEAEDIFSTPRETPRKLICKTPHKSFTPDAVENIDTSVFEPETPVSPVDEPTLTFLPRKSPRVSKAPLRFSFGEFENTSQLNEKKEVMSPRKTPRGTPRKTPSSTSSTSSGRFVLRPSRIRV